MTQEEQTLLIIKGSISDLPPEQQLAVKTAVDAIREVAAKAGKVNACYALALIGAQMQITGEI